MGGKLSFAAGQVKSGHGKEMTHNFINNGVLSAREGASRNLNSASERVGNTATNITNKLQETPERVREIKNKASSIISTSPEEMARKVEEKAKDKSKKTLTRVLDRIRGKRVPQKETRATVKFYANKFRNET